MPCFIVDIDCVDDSNGVDVNKAENEEVVQKTELDICWHGKDGGSGEDVDKGIDNTNDIDVFKVENEEVAHKTELDICWHGKESLLRISYDNIG